MRIDFYSPENCKFDSNLLWSRGLGGAEYSLVFLAEALAARGHRVVVWNDRNERTFYGAVEYAPINSCPLGTLVTDLFVIFRVSIPTRPAMAKRVVFFSCDQYTDDGWGRMIPWIDKFICISNFHRQYVANRYSIDDNRLDVCELGVNWPDYVLDVDDEKIKNQMIYCSIPHRGLNQLFDVWPMIVARVTFAKLMVTSDYRLWGRSNDPGNHEFTRRSAPLSNINFLGAVPRHQLVAAQRQSEIMAYPCIYDENFCIAAMECIAAGAVPVVLESGAIADTVGDCGIVVEGDVKNPDTIRRFAEAVIWLASNDEYRKELQNRGRARVARDYTFATVAKRFLTAAGSCRADQKHWCP